ncbi:MAG: class I SAM-dependent methyltransferase [Bdellovibrionota bacterium]
MNEGKSLLNKPAGFPQNWMKYPIQGFSALRAVHYFMQMQVLSNAARWLPLTQNMAKPLDKKSLELLKNEVKALVEADSENIALGIYPPSVLKPEPIFQHLLRIPQILWDGLQISWRRNKKATKKFSKEAQKNAAGLPEYYTRNFHFQTDGYLSTESAELYEHQVELLFTGMADAMRRLFIRPLKQALATDGVGENAALKVLEMASGTGRASRFVKLAFENSQVTVSDISQPYLKVAQKKLADLEQIDFVKADAAQTPFKDESFDLVFCVFLFHELPSDVRQKVIAEASRLLKPGGYFAAVDSIQLGDRTELDQFLVEFPQQFHEPFYTNYIKTPIEPLLNASGLQLITSDVGFLSRYWLAKKSNIFSN